MEVIYRTIDGLYPFHHKKEADLAFVEHIVKLLSPQQSQRYRDISRLYRTITCPHLIRLLKVLRDDNQIHFLYDYHETSLENYLGRQPQAQLRRLQQEIVCALNCLESAGLRAYVRIENVGVDGEGAVKLFVAPEEEEVREDLQKFYCTEKTRLKLELQELWDRFQNINVQQEEKTDKNPGFFISGNQLIFTKSQPSPPSIPSPTYENRLPETGSPKKQAGNPNLARNILSEIQKQKQIAQQLKSRRPISKFETMEVIEEEQGKGKYQPARGKEEGEKQGRLREEGERQGRLLKKESTNSDYMGKRQSHRTSTGCGTLLQNYKSTQERLTNSAAQPNNLNNGEQHTYSKLDDRPLSSIKSEKRQSFRNQQALSYQQIKAIASKHMEGEGGQQAKIQITTEMVSKYKMKIVTCQQIEFQGKQGDDIEKLAQEKLIQYQNQHGLPQIMIQNSNHSSNDQLITRDHSQKSGSYEQYREAREPSKTEHSQNQQIMAKIMKAKSKASTALKQYAKNKRK